MKNLALVVEDGAERGTARGNGDRTAGLALRALPGHAAARADLGFRQCPARSHHPVPAPDRGRLRGRGRHPRRDRRDAAFTRSGTTSASARRKSRRSRSSTGGARRLPPTRTTIGRLGRGSASASTFSSRPGSTKLIAAVAPAADDTFLEIGPGRGALTRAPGGPVVARVVAVEIDRDLAAALPSRVPATCPRRHGRLSRRSTCQPAARRGHARARGRQPSLQHFVAHPLPPARRGRRRAPVSRRDADAAEGGRRPDRRPARHLRVRHARRAGRVAGGRRSGC